MWAHGVVRAWKPSGNCENMSATALYDFVFKGII